MESERKKILFIQESLTGGGAEKVFVDLMRRLDRDKYCVTVLLLYGGGVHVASLPEDLELITLYERRSLLHKVRNHFIFTRDRMLKAAALKALKGLRFDTVISFLEGPAMKVHSMVRELGDRHLTWVHTDMRANRWTNYMFRDHEEERSMYAAMDAILFVSRGALDSFAEEYDVDRRKLAVIPNIVDRDAILENAAKFDAEKSRFTIVNVGRLASEKRQDRLIDVARILRDRGLDFEVWIVGTGPLEERLKRHVASLGLEDRVRLMGFCSNPYPYMKAADLFLLTSDAEGFSLVVCEALSLGLPVVSTCVTGVRERLSGGAGVLTSFEPEDIADKVYALATDPEALAGYAACALEKGREFNPDEVLNKIYSLI